MQMGIYDRNYYRDQDLPPLRPWDRHTMVTKLIIVNVALYLLNFIFTWRDNALTEMLVLRASDAFSPLQYYRILGYGFVHDPRGWTHIGFNMLALFFLGQAVETRYGRWEFLRIYLLAIVTGGIVFLLSHNLFRSGQGSVVGASGGVVAISMLFVFNYPQAQLYIWGILPVRAWIIGTIIVLTNLLGFAGPRDRVAFDVHLAGIAVATLYFFLNWNLGFLEQRGAGVSSLFRRRPKLKVRSYDQGADPERESADDAEADRILDKIYRDGQESLTAKEQKFIESYSRRVREKRAQR
jgi:membrane associated rhomboid family serine protease